MGYKEKVLFVYEDEVRGSELAKALEMSLSKKGLLDNFDVLLKNYPDKSKAAVGIKTVNPILLVLQKRMWDNNNGGFEVLEYFHENVSDFDPFYSIIHGANIGEAEKKRSWAIYKKDPYHLGTCTSDIRADDLFLEKISGVLAQEEEYIKYEHIESETAFTVEKLIKNIKEPLYPFRDAILKFRKGDGRCFQGVEKFMLNMDYELKKMRMYYNELFNLEVQRKKFGKIGDQVKQRGKRETSIDMVFGEVSQFLTHTRSPLVQMSLWLKSMNPSTKHYYEIYQFLEGKIGDYHIINYCRVFLEHFERFEKNLDIIMEYVKEKV